jgi:hypothetical protein
MSTEQKLDKLLNYFIDKYESGDEYFDRGYKMLKIIEADCGIVDQNSDPIYEYLCKNEFIKGVPYRITVTGILSGRNYFSNSKEINENKIITSEKERKQAELNLQKTTELSTGNLYVQMGIFGALVIQVILLYLSFALDAHWIPFVNHCGCH